MDRIVRDKSISNKIILAYPVGLSLIVGMIIPLADLFGFTSAVRIVFFILIAISLYQLPKNVYSLYIEKIHWNFTKKFCGCFFIFLITFFLFTRVVRSGTWHWGDNVLPVVGTILNDDAIGHIVLLAFLIFLVVSAVYNSFITRKIRVVVPDLKNSNV